MSTTSGLTDMLRSSLAHPTSGVVGLVDDLMTICEKQRLQVDWQAEHCVVRSLATGIEESIERPVRKSVFRAILARVAALCKERAASSVSPYGGEAEFPLRDGSDVALRVSFTNTSSEQRLLVTPVGGVDGSGEVRGRRGALPPQ